MKQPSNNQGSALLAVMIITGTIATILAGIGMVTLRELRLTSALEDSSLALAAAEAGIEEGLLRFRFDKNIEVPILPAGQEMSQAVTKANRVNLTTGSVQTNVDLGQNPPTSAESVYDLRVYYKTPAISGQKLFKDQTLELDVTNVQNHSLLMTFDFSSGTKGNVETQMVTVNGDGTTVEQCTEFIPSCKNFTQTNLSDQLVLSIPGGAVGGTGFRIRIKPLIFNVSDDSSAPDSSFITYSISDQLIFGQVLDSGTTFIESTGYFGAAKRKLLAKVDRTTGTVLSVFDFAIFSNQDITGS